MCLQLTSYWTLRSSLWKSPKERGLSPINRPDYSVTKNSNTILFIELKTKWNVDSEDPLPYRLVNAGLSDYKKKKKKKVDSEDIIQDYLDSHPSIYNAIQQVFGYLGDGKLRYGVLSTYDRSWFLYRPTEDPGCLKFSDCIGRASSNPTLFRCIAYILSLAVQGHECPPPPPQPPPSSLSDPLSVESSELDDEEMDPLYQPSEGSSGRRNTGTGKLGAADKGRKLQLEQFGWDSFMAINILGGGRCGTVYKAMFRGKESH